MKPYMMIVIVFIELVIGANTDIGMDVMMPAVFITVFGYFAYLEHKYKSDNSFDGIDEDTLREFMKSIDRTACFDSLLGTYAICGKAEAMLEACHAYNAHYHRNRQHRVVNGCIEGIPVSEINAALNKDNLSDYYPMNERISFIIYKKKHPECY